MRPPPGHVGSARNPRASPPPQTGSCGFGYQWPDVGTGFDVAAIADAAPEFGGSCGRCYEVKCDPQSAVPDGYGQTHERSSVCYDTSKTVVVRTVDNCPW